MDIAKSAALCLQALSVSILGLSFAGIKADSLPRFLQPLFIIPWYAYVILFVALIAVVITQKEKIRQIGSSPSPPPALQKVDAVQYQGVRWDIHAPPRQTLEKQADYAKRLPDIGEVKIPPKCPKCGVELEEKKGLVYGYIWRCVACGYKKRNRDSFSTEADRAGKIWRGKAGAAAAAAPEAITAAAAVRKE
jgi:hypothetical protein